ncbi:hypothetical protein [Nonomuraea angiospora]|uniref:hypothetical protein n=1 Tax=Nonomuraea angiospora TaxID=46172 RepID=UPI0029BD72FD|nr:hypothetical protein [Nonomuraea angiospora]MDX3104981.1 hypothetical protein [Nonomuraea angiospora]
MHPGEGFGVQAALVTAGDGGVAHQDGGAGEIVELRRAVRALFAQAVSPAPPSRADAQLTSG